MNSTVEHAGNGDNGMTSDFEATSNGRVSGRALPRAAGFTGRLLSSWGMAGGVVAGGFLLVGLMATERVSGNGLFATTLVLFIGGTIAGIIHGAVLGMLGRPPGQSAAESLSSLGLGALYLIPGIGASWILTGWVSQTLVAGYDGGTVARVGVGVAWVLAVALTAWAGWLGIRALRNAYARWPDPVLGTILVGLAYSALVVIFLSDRPEIWGTRVRVSTLGAFLLAGGATVWISGPGISLPLILVRRLPTPRPIRRPFKDGLPDLGGAVVGLLLGALVGGLAVWLSPWGGQIAPSDAGFGSVAVLAAARALIDELLLRLFLVVGAVWAFTRWHPLHREEAVVVAIVLAAVGQALLHSGALVAAGLPSTAAFLGAMALLHVVPGLVFGAVFVTLGFPAAWASHTVFLLVLGLLG